MEKLISRLQQDFPQFTFTPSDTLSWSAATQEIFYVPEKLSMAADGLLHELGHGILGHTDFTNDLDLVHKEVAAWQKAKELAKQYKIVINDDYVQSCLSSYRDWLHRRSTCPRCGSHGLQTPGKLYSCLNCSKTWNVSASRHKRPYRRSTDV